MFSIRKIISAICVIIGSKINQLAYIIYTSDKEEIKNKWLRENGDKTLRLDYDLNHDSIVFDVGGFEGQWASDMYSKYCCNIHIFEPVPIYYNNIAKRFKKNSKIYVYNIGLAGKTSTEKLALCEDGSSIYKVGNETVEIKLVKFDEFMNNNKIDKIDLLKVNIEGGEYELLDNIIQSGIVHKINNIQVQFHDFVQNSEQRMQDIQNKLILTHELTYQYLFVWENWKLKSM